MQEYRIGQESTNSTIGMLGRRCNSNCVDGMRLFYSASGIELRARCSCVQVELEADFAEHCPWIGVMVDYAPVTRFPVEKGRKWYTVLDGMDSGYVHSMQILRDTQPIEKTDRLILHAVRLDGEALAVEKPVWNLEFVGDSLTTGEGLKGPFGAQEWITAWMSSMETWSMEVCRQLHARGRWISQCGWGVCVGWNGDRNSNIPGIYDAVCAIEEGGEEEFDFSSDTVDAIVVNLGTNDAGGLNTFPDEEKPQLIKDIAKSTEAFLRKLRQRNPNACILWVYGMCEDSLTEVLSTAVLSMKQEGDPKVDFLLLPACPPQEFGAREHPGPVFQAEAGRKIAEKLRQMLTDKQECPKTQQ